jgi:ribose transport system ATP-binding protein
VSSGMSGEEGQRSHLARQSEAPLSQSDPDILLSVNSVRKTFGRTRVLDVDSIALQRGHVYGLLGANGSGKSTLVKILTGSLNPDAGASGTIGQAAIRWPIRAGENGFAVVPQEMSLCPSLTVLDNLLVTRKRRSGLLSRIRWREERLHAAELLQRVGLDCSVRQLVANLTAAEAALLCIARAVEDLDASSSTTKLLILDEPTSALSAEDASRIFSVSRSLAAEGAAVVIVNHRLGEVRASSDEVFVLRDGQVAARGLLDHLDDDSLIEAMFGTRVSAAKPLRQTEGAEGGVALPRSQAPDDVPLLHVRRHLSDGGQSLLMAYQNQTVGVTGLAGMDHDRLPYQFLGLPPKSQFSVEIDGVAVTRSPRAMRAAGVRLLPADRAKDVFWSAGTVSENYTITEVSNQSRGLSLNRKRLRSITAQMISDYDVKGPGIDAPISALSGGNQQKVSIARAIAAGQWRILLAHEPTEGIDVATRYEILGQLKNLATNGRAIVIFGADYHALASICDVVYVFTPAEGIRVLTEDEISEVNIGRAAMATISGEDL